MHSDNEPVGRRFLRACADALLDGKSVAVTTLVALIARSPIVVKGSAAPADGGPRWAGCDLPAGFDAVDVAVLDWIASEGRSAGHRFLLM
jgi:hypothetical protein